MTEELKLCPFCGNNPEKCISEDGYFWIVCKNCGVYVVRRDPGAAEEQWNRRPEEERLRKRIEELEKCLAKFTKWDRDFPVGYSPYSGLYEFNAIIAEAEELLKGSDHE